MSKFVFFCSCCGDKCVSAMESKVCVFGCFFVLGFVLVVGCVKGSQFKS